MTKLGTVLVEYRVAADPAQLMHDLEVFLKMQKAVQHINQTAVHAVGYTIQPNEQGKNV